MKRLRFLAIFPLLLAGTAAAQELRSGPNAPAVSSQVPPSDPPPAGRAGPDDPGRAPGDANARTGADDARTSPPPDHRVLGGPPLPEARQPQRSEGFGGASDPVPARPGARPDASTTGR